MSKKKEIHSFSIGKERLEAFCDAVIAIAITLLVLEMKVPHISHSESNLLIAIAKQFPIYLSTIVSFFIIACFWLNHHRLCNMLEKISHGYIILTLLWLFSMCLIPYSTELVGEYILNGDLIYTVTPIYTGVNGFVVICWILIWNYIKKSNLLKENINLEAIRHDTKSNYISLVIWCGLFVISFFLPYIAILGVMLVTAFYCFPRKHLF
ncbi:MAG: TMEM175 family protein [Proteobacteria bacterium]|nr:TMEM175 family protein [Pseudomonadota bacterium]